MVFVSVIIDFTPSLFVIRIQTGLSHKGYQNL